MIAKKDDDNCQENVDDIADKFHISVPIIIANDSYALNWLFFPAVDEMIPIILTRIDVCRNVLYLNITTFTRQWKCHCLGRCITITKVLEDCSAGASKFTSVE